MQFCSPTPVAKGCFFFAILCAITLTAFFLCFFSLPKSDFLPRPVPFVFKINENFFHHSKNYLHFPTFPAMPITPFSIVPQNVSFCREDTHYVVWSTFQNSCWMVTICMYLADSAVRMNPLKSKIFCLILKSSCLKILHISFFIL